MYAKQNTFGYSDPPAVIVIAGVILQDVRETKSLLAVFTPFIPNTVFPHVSFEIYNKNQTAAM